MSQLTHLDARGQAHMVDVSAKASTQRVAVAVGSLRVSSSTLSLIQEGRAPKGDVLAVARVAGIMAAKSTHQLIPLCHQIALTSVSVELTLNPSQRTIDIKATVGCLGQTGVEMEALTAVSISALTLYDMLKAVDSEMSVEAVSLVEKQGGRSASKRDRSQVEPSASGSVSEPRTNQEGLIPPPPVGRTFKVIAKSHAPSESTDGVSRQRFDELSLLGDEPSSERALNLVAEPIPSVNVPLDSSDKQGEEGLISSCPPPKIPIRGVAALQPQDSAVSELLQEDDARWDESILHESALESESESEGAINPPSLSQAARKMAQDVREVGLDDHAFRDFLTSRPLDAAYLLGYLTPGYEPSCRAFVYERGVSTQEGERGTVEAILFEYTGLSVPTIWTLGGTLEVEAIISHVYSELPRRIYFNMEDHHLQAVRTHYAIRDRKPTLCMGLKKAHYVPTEHVEEVVTLSHKDTGGIMRLYHQYPDHLFEPAQLDTGLYRGVKSDGGSLVSVAGIHFLNPGFNIAAIGNIVTDSDHRGQGLATRCVGVLLDELFDRVDHVALNVTEDNLAAIACYEKFGFRTTSRIIEAWGKLR